MEVTSPAWVLDALRSSAGQAMLGTLIPEHGGVEGASDPIGSDPGKDPRFRHLVEAIFFQRRFVKTYNLVLLGALGVLAVRYWREKVALGRKRWRIQNSDGAGGEVGEVWSSSSSTIEETSTPPDWGMKRNGGADERTALLSPNEQKRQPLTMWKPYYVIKSWMQYQPRPIPIINKTLPTNTVSLVVIAYIALNVFYNFYAIPMSFQYLFVFADRCGLIFSANLPLLYLLAAKNQPIKLLTGHSYESLNIFHRRVGELMCFEALLHFVGMLFVWYGLLRRLGFTLARFILNKLVLLGIGAFVSYEALYFTSLGSFRQRMYEIFLTSHIVLQTAGLAFLWFHYPTSRIYVGTSAAIFLLDRFLFRLYMKSTTHPATLTLLNDNKTLLVSANWATSPKSSFLTPSNMQSGWKPNDHVFLTVPALSRKHALQAHPFTIFSAAPTVSVNEDQTHAWFSLLIRPQSPQGFTHALLAHARTHGQTRIRLDGPYGSSHALDTLAAAHTAILVAGGSGIAVAYPLLYALLRPATNDAEAGPRRPRRSVRLLWVTHAAAHREWVPKDKMKELVEWGLELHIPPPTVVAGRPDVRAVIEAWVGGGDGKRGGSAAVVVSGPDGLVRDVRNGCAGLVARGVDVRVQVEKFGW